jgi:hypothetical protein
MIVRKLFTQHSPYFKVEKSKVYFDGGYSKFSLGDLKMLAQKFGTFIDNSRLVERNWVIAGTPDFGFSIRELMENDRITCDEADSLLALNDGRDWVQADIADTFYCVGDIYWYLRCTEDEADRYLAVELGT